jgi:hypothetical protein
MEMLMRVAEATAVGMLMSMKAMDGSIALLYAIEFPYRRRDIRLLGTNLARFIGDRYGALGSPAPSPKDIAYEMTRPRK